jgi:hypothetical protein
VAARYAVVTNDDPPAEPATVPATKTADPSGLTAMSRSPVVPFTILVHSPAPVAAS